jgi:hypothetical protein
MAADSAGSELEIEGAVEGEQSRLGSLGQLPLLLGVV